MRSNEIFSSWPLVALMAGVKIGSGSLSDSRNPAGSLIPHTEPLFLYSFHPEPEMYPRTTHSMVTMSALTTSIERPRNWSAYFCNSAGYCAMSAVARWLGTMSLRNSNQNSESCVSTRPFSGMPVAST